MILLASSTTPLHDSTMGPCQEKKGLPSTWTDRILSFLPSWTHSRRRDFLFVERTAQRRFLNEYRSQLKQYEPVLRARGEM